MLEKQIPRGKLQYMTTILEEALEQIREMPQQQQDAAGELLLTMAARDTQPRFELTPEQVEDVHAAIAEADRDELASDEEVDAFFKSHGL